jgi:acyl-CoA synthetase (AMP-forming)/AMP-acid ligase II
VADWVIDDADRELPWDDASVGELEVSGRPGFLTLTDRSKDVIKSGG